MPPPVLVFVPGAFQTPQVFSPLCKHLSLLGQTCLCVSLPSTGADPPHPDRTQDVLAVQNVIAEAVGRTNKNVVVVAHAEGGTVAIEAVKGLHATGRGREVWGLVFLAGVVLPAGKALTDFQEDLFPDGQQPYFESDGRAFVIPDPAEKALYGDLRPAAAAEWTSQLQTASYGTFDQKTETRLDPLWHRTYLILDSPYISISLQRRWIEGATETGTWDLVETFEGGGGHSPFLTRPEEVGAFLARAVKAIELGVKSSH